MFGTREKFLILNIEPAGPRTVVFGVGEDKNIRFQKNLDDWNIPKFFKDISRKNMTAVVSLHPALGAVRIVPFKFVRQTQSAPLEHTELENFLAQLSQKAFLEFRADVADELGIDELDAILVESKPFAYRADGSSVSSPIGHKSKEIHGFLELLFTTRDAFDLMQPTIYSGNPVFMTLHDKSELMSLKKMGMEKISLLEFSEEGGARLLKFDLDKKNDMPASRKSVAWSPSRFFTRLEELWNVDRKTAMSIYFLYLKDEVSPKLKAQIEKIWNKETSTLFSALRQAGARGEVYVKTWMPLPLTLPARQKGITLLEFPFGDIFDRLGFTFEGKLSELSPREAFAQLSPFVECYYDSSDPQVSHSLRRRIHWLIG
ncbi:MAG: hypothetical protein LiPW15_28 [Parcubacteria group bacterium LiPW_15]|nr:MAG: hypothetical protein LiPW15_28 [Parcubacteria group bacterium LiPW_15]